MPKVSLLPFPPPYRAALALSNDIDDVADPASWWEFLRFLNTNESTRFGSGLGLEVGDSFWMWSGDPAYQPASFFVGLDDRPSEFAPYIRALGRAGYLDTLHSYGYFSRRGGFRREHARRALQVLRDEGIQPRVWINHGGPHDFQNLLTGWGDLPESIHTDGPTAEYHLDLTRDFGMRYAWVGELTQVVGQERALGPRDWLMPGSPLPRELLRSVGRALAQRTAYRHVLESYPNPNPASNKLLRPQRFRDGTVLQTFVRYGTYAHSNLDGIEWLLSHQTLDSLESSGGVSIMMVHWGKHPGRRFEALPDRVVEALGELAARAHRRRIWVTTTQRLLTYCEARRAVVFETREVAGGGLEVLLRSGEIPGGRRLCREDLEGLTFRVPDHGQTRFMWEGSPLTMVPVEGCEETLTVPWSTLSFPERPDER